MNGIWYENTHTSIPTWVNNLHTTQQLGYAYETDTHFVHFYGQNIGFNVISVGLTTIESKSGALTDWVQRVFGAQNIQNLTNEIGHVKKGVWRPSLYFSNDIENALEIDEFEKRASEQALRILIEKLDDILLYIEPDYNGLNSYSHKCRELLILACTEVENQFVSIISNTNLSRPNQRYTTNDYVKLLDNCFLNEFKVQYLNYSGLKDFKPFNGWDPTNPTVSLIWYDAYNKTKHARAGSFHFSTLENVMDAVAACIVMHCVKYGPFSLLAPNTSLATIINQHFKISLDNSNPANYYIPEIELPLTIRSDLFIYDCYKEGHNKNWVTEPLIL
ncbi:hypothetical protein H4F38_07725 [Pectobacterium brasiliense]|uniref:hypothetical protein n=1 Tax=Pectobacterium brasiliense TaxID=180957 RepID=UPI00057F2E18|nr:hypothetical protein [Pectobacterium brasiliense]APS29452.1 membrane protein [Pectobacterium brasiliense]KHS98806.1 membrane protein [Pectobacterium brasiliense]MBN3097646.1 hypothetical protein [Pectobacterium brasiliense]MBN3163603.1 hypothetical protein [Pectobacterium brasiliense]MBN3183633.1 hypothetical protein [Pectobacterium brasiliense]